MLRIVVHLLVIVFFMVSLSACGLRGNLKSPAEIAYQKQKQERRNAKKSKTGEQEVSQDDTDVALPHTSLRDERSYNEILKEQPFPTTPSNHVGY